MNTLDRSKHIRHCTNFTLHIKRKVRHATIDARLCGAARESIPLLNATVPTPEDRGFKSRERHCYVSAATRTSGSLTLAVRLRDEGEASRPGLDMTAARLGRAAPSDKTPDPRPYDPDQAELDAMELDDYLAERRAEHEREKARLIARKAARLALLQE